MVLRMLGVWLLVFVGLQSTSDAQSQYVNRAHPSVQGLMAWYVARPGFVGGPWWYDVTGLNHGTLTNMGSGDPTSGWQRSTRPGSAGEVRFDGTDDYVTIPTSAALESPERTVMMWVKLRVADGNYKALIANNTDIDYFNVFLRSGSRLAVYFTTTEDSDALDTAAGFSLTTGVWTHVTLTFTPGELRTYFNCRFDESRARGGTLVASGAPTLLGAKGATPANWFPGMLDDIRIYNRALTPTDICAVMYESDHGNRAVFDQSILPGFLQVVSTRKGSFFPFFRGQ